MLNILVEMKNRSNLCLLFCLLLLAGLMPAAWAQPAVPAGQEELHIRESDQFWRKRVVNRISLIEKVNAPLVKHHSNYYGQSERYPEKEGMVVALLNGLADGEYVAYHPEDWNQPLSYEEVLSRMRENEQAFSEGSDWYAEEEEEILEENPYSGDEWDISWEDEGAEDWASPFEEAPGVAGSEKLDAPETGVYEEVIHLVEDWIFDQRRSMMEQKPAFFEVVWVDPSGMLPEKVLARFMWEDVKDRLDQTLWQTRFNDAQARSVKEVMELRIFNSILINVGGEGVRTLQEAARRKQELIEFEHHLWSY